MFFLVIQKFFQTDESTFTIPSVIVQHIIFIAIHQNDPLFNKSRHDSSASFYEQKINRSKHYDYLLSIP